MTLDEMVKRARLDYNSLVARYNADGAELFTLENKHRRSDEDNARLDDLRARHARDAAHVQEKNDRLVQLEMEALQDGVAERMAATPGWVRADRADEARGVTLSGSGGINIREAATYRKDNQREVSYFRDLVNAGKGDLHAAERLQRNESEWRDRNPVEARALDTSSTAGGTFAPPAWLVDDFIALSRASRVTADLLHVESLPERVSSVNLPKVATGSVAAVMATQNTSISEVDVTTTSVSSGIATIAGGQTVSLQLLSQSGTPIDQVVLADLAADYARAFNLQVLSGSGLNGQLRGVLTVTAGTTIAYTTAAPKVVSTTAADSFYSAILDAKLGVESGRFVSPDAIVMHPRRWNWVLKALDGDGRPLVVPSASLNAPGIGGAPVAVGLAGELAGIPVFVDPLIPTNLGVATNQDTVMLFKRDDLHLWESQLRLEVFNEVLAQQGSVYFRAFGFAALIADRVPASIARISGTGLVTP